MEGILQIIHEGGDADSNTAVAGALLGARFGFLRMPQKLANALINKQALDSRIGKLTNLLEQR
jgi:ADP-ribosylglycohydrolase